MALVLVTHGTRDPAGAVTAGALADAVAGRLPGVPVSVAFADVRGPTVAEALGEWDVPAVVVPVFLAAGYHVRVDLPAQIAATGRPDVRLTASLGAASAVGAVVDRLTDAGRRDSDAVVLAAAGSSDVRARAQVQRAARLLAESLGRPVEVGYIATGWPGVHEVVTRLRRPGRRVVVASWLLAPGLFHRWLGQVGADVVTEPIGAHPLVVAEIVLRYRGQSNRLGGSSRMAWASTQR